VLGDLNDFDADVPDINDSRPKSNVLATIRSAGAGADDDLINVLEDVPVDERFTAFYDPDKDGCISRDEFSAIDHVLLSPRLYEHVVSVQYVHSFPAVVQNDPLHVSDHFPIVVTFSEN